MIISRPVHVQKYQGICIHSIITARCHAMPEPASESMKHRLRHLLLPKPLKFSKVLVASKC